MVKKHKKQAKARHAGDLVARPKTYKVKPHHAKPYRKRHLGLLVFALIFLLLVVFQVGILVGSSRQKVADQPIPSSPGIPLQSLRSSYGFNFEFDASLFTPTATAIDGKGTGRHISEAQLDDNLQINFVTLRPKATAVAGSVTPSQLSVQIDPATAAFLALKADPANAGKTDTQLAAQLAPVTSSADFDVMKVSQDEEALEDGTPVLKTTYQYTPKFSGGISYAVVWSGAIENRPFTIKLSGLLDSSAIPSEYAGIFSSFSFAGGPKVEGISFRPEGRAYAESTLDSKYLSDSVSPAVVKIYHIVCGTLIVGSSNYGEDCTGMTGSGFLVSHDGYIATNGHVTVLTAQDIVVKIITRSPQGLLGYLRGIGLSDAQIAGLARDPQKLAAVVAKIYDTNDSQIRLDNKKEATIVALGKNPLEIKSAEEIKTLMDFQDRDDLKRAEVVGFDYSGKDLLTAQSGDPAGFSSSDVALLKINTKNAPLIKLNTNAVTQNEKITVLGFPGDAENSLVDNSSLDVSVTNGSISAIKEAAGGAAKLYQSDVDASHGNSGGPAINELGLAFGLLTYRVASGNQGDAAKSYMRDIADFVELAEGKNIQFAVSSTTQDAWMNGLTLFSQNHFSAAKKDFAKVKENYPTHRLVDGYIENANQQIAAGNDVKLYPVPLIIGAVVLALALVIGAVVMIVRHRAKHQAYVSQQPPSGNPGSSTGTPSAPIGQVPPVTMGQSIATPPHPPAPVMAPVSPQPIPSTPPVAFPVSPTPVIAQQRPVLDQIVAPPASVNPPRPDSSPTVITPTQSPQ